MRRRRRGGGESRRRRRRSWMYSTDIISVAAREEVKEEPSISFFCGGNGQII
jgi:hypothetical protein